MAAQVSKTISTPESQMEVHPTPSQDYVSEVGIQPDVSETTALLGQEGGNITESTEVQHYKHIDGKRFWLLFASIISAYLLAFFDSTFMASSHPVITSHFNASNSASWLSTVFYLTSTVFQPMYGRVSDVTGRKPVYLFAIVMFALTTAWCGMAQTIGSFIAARAVCGLGAGGVTSMANILLSDTVKIEYRGIYQSYLNMSYGLGNGLGAALGGLLCDRLGWRAAFFVQLPFIFCLAVLAFVATPNDLGPCLAQSQGKGLVQAFKSFDFTGSTLLTLAVTGLILGINLGGNVLSWTHPIVITSLVIFVVATIVLIPVEKKAERPMLPLSLLTSVPSGNLNWANLLSAILTSAVLFNVPLFLQAVKQASPTLSGLVLISPLLGVSISSVFAGFFIERTRRLKPCMIIGTSSILAGMVALGCLNPHVPTWAVLLLNPWVSIGQGFFFPATTVSLLAINTADAQAVVVTTLGLFRSLGSILGVALSSWVFQNALNLYLLQTVTGTISEKSKIISEVRKSVKAIARLDPEHKAQVIQAYAISLRITFLSGLLFAIIVCCLIFPAPIQNLQRSRRVGSVKDDMEETGENQTGTTP